MKSLFVVSLPRSLSTTLYQAAARALGLREPTWTTGGEILNRERARIGRRGLRVTNARFTVRESEPELFDRVGAHLDASVVTSGFAYKDVVQPFVVADWLDPAEFCVLKIERDVAEVAYAMAKRRWHYPGDAASLHDAHPLALIEGLVRAEQALASLPGETVGYTDAVVSHEPLRDALQVLYPERSLGPIEYIDRGFERTRARLEQERCDSELFTQLQHAVDEVRSTLDGHLSAGRPALATLERLAPLSAAAST